MDSEQPNDPIGQRIIDAAANAIIEDGFGAATTEAIAKAAKTSKRAIYERFPDRDALFREVMAHLCATAGDGAAPLPANLPLDQSLHAWAKALLLRFTSRRGRRIFSAAVAATPYFPSAVTVFWDSGPGRAAEGIARRLRDEKRIGTLRNIQPRREAQRFVLQCCGPLVLDQLVNPERDVSPQAIDRHASETVSVFLASIQA